MPPCAPRTADAAGGVPVRYLLVSRGQGPCLLVCRPLHGLKASPLTRDVLERRTRFTRHEDRSYERNEELACARSEEWAVAHDEERPSGRNGGKFPAAQAAARFSIVHFSFFIVHLFGFLKGCRRGREPQLLGCFGLIIDKIGGIFAFFACFGLAGMLKVVMIHYGCTVYTRPYCSTDNFTQKNHLHSS